MSSVAARTGLGGALVLLCVWVAVVFAQGEHLAAMAAISAVAWVISVALTDKYVNKYPQRYMSYLLASHVKAAITMAVPLWGLSYLVGRVLAPPIILWESYGLFVLMDACASVLWRQPAPVHVGVAPARPPSSARPSKQSTELGTGIWDGGSTLDAPFAAFISSQVPSEVWSNQPSSGMLTVSLTRLNDIRRLSKFFRACAKRTRQGGYFAGRYTPLENVEKDLRRRYAGALHYPVAALHFAWRRAFPKIPYVNALYFAITNGRNRVISRTEIWGRLQACGMTVIGETVGDGEVYLIAHKTSDPVASRTPSYYPVIALERVTLDGQIMRAHKVRTMYPFSEFIQKQVFEANALHATGKFAGDFRITGYGRVLRKYWIDEIPGILDWWRGEIKLVGVRAMSRHYFSLYPKDFQDLFIKVKPGLVPPLFGESTAGFQHIVDVERRYLEAYLHHPARTDVRYLLTTVNDIVFKGVRSQ